MSEHPRGFGSVEISSEAEAEAAVDSLHEKDSGSRNLTVNFAREPRGGGGGDIAAEEVPFGGDRDRGPRR